MIGAEAVIGWMTSDRTFSLKPYVLQGRTPANITFDPNYVLYNTSVCIENGRTTIRFSRNLNQGLIKINTKGGSTPIIMAMGRLPQLHYHDTNREYLSVDFVNGEKISQKIIHGVFMSLGWVIIYIGGIYVSIYKEAGESKKYVHIAFQSLGIVCTLIGLPVIIFSVSGPHFNTPNNHSFFGIGTISLVVAQSVLGFVIFRKMRDNGDYKTIKKVHGWIGWLAMILSMVTIALGILTLFDQFLTFWTGIFFGIVSSIVLLILMVLSSKIFCGNSSYKTVKQEDDGVIY